MIRAALARVGNRASMVDAVLHFPGTARSDASLGFSQHLAR
jgi:hypothetical protein